MYFWKVKRNQLDTFLQLEGSQEQSEERPPSYNDLEGGGGGGVDPSLLLPPSYSDLEGGGATGGAGDRYSTAFEEQELELKDAVWYQAGLPRYVHYTVLLLSVFYLNNMCTYLYM